MFIHIVDLNLGSFCAQQPASALTQKFKLKFLHHMCIKLCKTVAAFLFFLIFSFAKNMDIVKEEYQVIILG